MPTSPTSPARTGLLRRRAETPRTIAVALILLAATLPTAALAAQGGKGNPVPDVTLLRRIAEAVEGDRSGGQVYVVASLDGLHPVAGTFPDPKSAEQAAFDLGGGFQVFGPYQAPPEPPPGLTVGCVHNSRNSMMHIRTLCVPPRRPVEFEDVARITLLLERVDGRIDTLPLPKGGDAIFLTLTAFDKFALPYYERTLGLAGATEMRQGFVTVYQTGRVPRGNDKD